MKFKDYVKKLNKLMEDNPETADYLVVTCEDDEGNGYHLVHYDPAVGYYDENEKEFTAEYFTAEYKPNSVCVN